MEKKEEPIAGPSNRHNDHYNSDEEDPYATDDTGSDYSPSSEEFESDQEPLRNVSNHIHNPPKRTRKRLRKISEWKKNKNKALRLRGEEYSTMTGKIINKRAVREYEHTCRYECHKITNEERETLFKKFYNIIESHELQTNFIASCIKKKNPIRKKQTASCNRKFVTHITLMNFRVCKQFFLKTLDITNRRFNVVCNKISPEGIVESDKRGKHVPGNKICNERILDVITHIKTFPKYKSHYSRAHNENTKYLSPDLSIRKMYELYIVWCTDFGKQPVKESYYRHIFCTQFNLKFHKPHSDTCHTCDRLTNIIKCNDNESNEHKTAKAEILVHQRKAESVLDNKAKDITYARENKNVCVICFDLQKTLPTPLLTTNKVFYLRQLWTYNFCVYDLVSGKSYMYVWNETISSRGAAEIMSCLLKFIENLPNSIDLLICYSDSCGGQNKNKHLTKFFMYLVQCSSLTRIDHKFFVPGHSYMECDRSFGLIEKRKKKIPQVYIPQHWTDLIRKTSKNFLVFEMGMEDFLSHSHLNTIMKDPKFTDQVICPSVEDDGNAVQHHTSNENIRTGGTKRKRVPKNTQVRAPLKWRNIVWFRYEKDNFFSFSFKDTQNTEFPFLNSEKCSKLSTGRPNLHLNTLHNTKLNDVPLKITYAKWANLIELLPFIPPIHHTFYREMPHQLQQKKNKAGGKNAAGTVTQEVEKVNQESEEETLEENFELDDNILESDYDQ